MRGGLDGTDVAGTTGAVLFAGTANRSDPDPTESPRTLGTILIVDNDAVLRMLLTKFLTFVGYTALEARSGAEALKLAKRHPETIDLLLTDVMMPGMNGFELVEVFPDFHPETKVLYMSGHVFDVPAVGDAAKAHPDAFMIKPFWAEQLLEKVQSLLPSPGPSGQS